MCASMITYALSNSLRFLDVFTLGWASSLPSPGVADLRVFEENRELIEPGVIPYELRDTLLYLKLRGSGIDDMSRF